jgi:hypothetical protein
MHCKEQWGRRCSHVDGSDDVAEVLVHELFGLGGLEIVVRIEFIQSRYQVAEQPPGRRLAQVPK